MTISNELMYAILAMDSYNQGYGEGIKHGKTQIGTAEKGIESDTEISAITSASAAAGFYAAAYTYDGGTVISYRGTNTAPEGAMNLKLR